MKLTKRFTAYHKPINFEKYIFEDYEKQEGRGSESMNTGTHLRA
ncbi:hypothetical protein [Jeotgalibacillus marinus]|uniref:Uncharacterized protein n=1 Tax=Jeotgalibacillus marinus TaxID=86667 RepID=A0ABV3Q845_9BACL